LRASPRGYYAWRKRWQQDQQRQLSEDELVSAIKTIQEKVRFRFGSPRVHHELKKDGRRHGRKRVAKLMRDKQLHCRLKRAFKRTTNSKGDNNVAPDLVKRVFSADRPNQLWTSDITYIRLKHGWAYLCVILDVFSRRIVGWSVDGRMTQRLVLRSLYMATKRRRQHRGVIFHTDRGSQYKANSVVKFCKKAGIERSMGDTGSCYDNAITETFNASYKDEILFPYIPRSVEEAKAYTGRYIELFYNMHRPHSALEYLSPMDFESRWWREKNLNLV
jgi:transposase InsO family protein